MAKKRKKQKVSHPPSTAPALTRPGPATTSRGWTVLAWLALIALVLLILAVLETIKEGLLGAGT